MPSILYQFRVNSDTDPLLFETLDNVPSSERSEYIREKLKVGILADPDKPIMPISSVTHEKSDDVLPSPSVSRPHRGGFSDREVKASIEKLNADPLIVGNTKPVLPSPTGETDAGLQAHLARLQRQKETRERLDKPKPEIKK